MLVPFRCPVLVLLSMAVSHHFVSIAACNVRLQFQAAVVKPLPKMEARLRAVLLASFGTGER